MTANGWLQIASFFLLVLLVTKPLGVFMERVFSRKKTFLDPVLRPLERLLYRVTGVDETQEMRWTEYAIAMLLFSGVSMGLLYLIERVQQWMPWNPQKLGAVATDLAFNTAASFTTNTNWQAYVPETTMTYFTQMAGLAYHNFASAAVGIALAIAVIRGVARREQDTIGNFWVDLTRCFLWVLLPACLVIAMLFVSQGVIQNMNPYTTAQLVDPQTVQVTGTDGKTTPQAVREQVIPQGPIASQEAIKIFGTNGGGFLNANSAHPYENPTPLTNFIQLILIFAIPSGLTYTLGRMTGSQKHGWAVWSAMAVLFAAGVTGAYTAEAKGNPLLTGADQSVTAQQPGGNMEGKEVRFGIANSALYATVTTDASCGAVNAMHDSFTPLGGMVPLINIMLGEVVFGGVGSGLYGMIVFVILSVFIAGLMVGRTPEYLGKKIEAFDVKMAMLSVLIFPLLILSFTAISVVAPKFGFPVLPMPARTDCPKSSMPHVEAGQQRLGICRAERQHALVQHDDWRSRCCSAVSSWSFQCWRLPAAWRQKKYVPESPARFPVTTPLFTALLDLRDSNCRRIDILPRAQPGPDPGAPADARGKDFLRQP